MSVDCNRVLKRLFGFMCRALAVLLVVVSAVGCGSEEKDEASVADLQYGDGYWAELAQNFEPFVAEPNVGAAYSETDWISVGRWGDVIEWPQIAVGAANRPDGRVMTWSAEYPNTFGSKLERNIASVFDPASRQFVDADFNGHNMFCAGVAMLPDGEVLLAGGGQTISETSVFDAETFRQEEKLHLSRWYPTSTTLPSGQVLTSLGTKTAPWSELWTAGQGWHLLDDFSLNFIIDENVGVNFSDWYPALSVTPDGSLFHTGPMSELFSLDLHASVPITRHGPRILADGDRLYGVSVMYDVGKMLVAGGGNNNSQNTAMTIDVNGSAPVVRAISSMQYKRAMQNSLVLPNGEVLVIGGNTSGQQFSDNGTVLTPEMWNPTTEQWRILAPHEKPRNYHSTALLLQDATVISMGGGLCGGCPTNHQNGEIFEPPYLFDAAGNYAARPQIIDGPEIALPGETVTLHGTDDVVKFNMVRLIAMTHHHSTDQRLVPLSFSRSGAGQYSVDIYPNPNVSIPGYYWIFGLNDAGVPSVGHLIKVAVAPENIPPVVQTATNVAFEYYEGSWNTIPDFNALVPAKTGVQADFSLRDRERIGDYGFRFRGTLTVPTNGQYKFYLSSDDGSRIKLDGKTIVDHDGKHPFTSEEESNNLFLNAGSHIIEVEYFETDGGDSLLASWSGPGFDKKPISESDLGSGNRPDVLPEAFSTFSTFINSGDRFLSYQYFEGDWMQLPNFDELTPIAKGQLANFSLAPRQRDDYYGFRFIGNIEAPVDGIYTFYLKSDDGSRLYIDGNLVVDNDGTHGAWLDVPGGVALTAGSHEITVEFFERNGLESLLVSWQVPGFSKQQFSENDFHASEIDLQSGGVVPNGSSETFVAMDGELAYEYYEGDWFNLPSFESLTALETGSQQSFSVAGKKVEDFYGYRFAAYVEIIDAGEYTFYLESDDGSRLEVNGNVIVDNDGLHPIVEAKGSVILPAGRHHLLVEFFERTGGDELTVSWAGPNFLRQPISEDVLSTAPFDFSPASSVSTEDLLYEVFIGNWTELPDFSLLTPVLTGRIEDFSLLPAGDESHFGILYSGQLRIDVPGLYTFYTNSNDGSKLFIDGQLVVDNDGKHGLILEQGQVALSSGLHDLSLQYFQSGGGKGLEVMWAGPGFDQRALPTDVTFGPAEIVNASSVPEVSLPTTTATPVTDVPVVPFEDQLEYSYYEGDWTKLPDFESLTPSETGFSDNFVLVNEGELDNYGLLFKGTLETSEMGDYFFFVASNDGSQLFVDGGLVVNNDGKHGDKEVVGKIALDPGLHSIELRYFQSGGGESLSVQWQGPGFSREDIPDELLYSSK